MTDRLLVSAQSLQQCAGGGGSTELGPFDEVDKAVTPLLRRQPAEVLRPAVERIGRIAQGFVFGTAPQAGVYEVGGHIFKGGVVVVVDVRDRDTVPAQEFYEGA